MAPLVDPFSASSKPMPMVDSMPSQPLPFAATLLPIDPNTSAPVARLPRPLRQQDGIPQVFPSPPYSHSRQASAMSIRDTLGELHLGSPIAPEMMQQGSDEWMQKVVARCVDSAKGEVKLDRLQLGRLSTKISDLRDLVMLPTMGSPQASKSLMRSPNPTTSPLRSPLLNPPSSSTNFFAGNASSFTRSVSAPAKAQFFNGGATPTQEVAGSSLAGLSYVPGSPTTTEASEGNEVADGVGLLSSPSILAPARATPAFGAAGLGHGRRPMGRSQTSKFGVPAKTKAVDKAMPMNVQLYLAQNALTSIPSALFEVTNLTVLSLRNNGLTSLPAAIGHLVNLKSLNVAINKLTELPSTILLLENLDTGPAGFTASPNPWHTPPEEGTFSLLIQHYDHPVSRLKDICLQLLLSPQGPARLPPLLEGYDWRPSYGAPHPLVDPGAMHEVMPHMPEADVHRVLQLLRSASNTFAHERRINPSRYSGVVDPFPRSHRTPPPDDASTNPFYYRCPSPRHLEMDEHPRGHLFLHPAEERLEWRKFNGETVPLKWMGCSPGCLAFLEQTDEDDEWEIDAEEIAAE
ncbi:hypothetical protein IAT38_002327 [Cryptococcus sp. DSM 104549]